MAFKSPTTPTAPYVDAGLINQNENQGWQTFTFGPFDAAASNAVDRTLPFIARELMQIKSVTLFADTKVGSSGNNFNLLARQAGESLSAAVTAARTVCAQTDIGGSGFSNTVPLDVTVTPGTHFTYLQPGDSLVADFPSTVTSLAGFLITVQMRRVRDGFARL